MSVLHSVIATDFVFECSPEITQSFDPAAQYLTDPKTCKRLWKGPEATVAFGATESRVMIRGSDSGVPICYLKGGPGSAPVSSAQKRYWRPEEMRVALSSWRGCGETSDLGSITENNVEGLVEDVESMRRTLGVDQMLLTGYCWGGTVAFEYAKRFPEKTSGIVIMLPYLARAIDIEQGFGPSGIAEKYPEAYSAFRNGDKEGDLKSVFTRYAQALSRDLRSVEAIQAYANWVNWEYASSGETTMIDPAIVDPNEKQNLWAIAGERINVHYLLNNYFLPDDGVSSCLSVVNQLAKEGKPVCYVANEFDPLMAPDHLSALRQGLPDAQSIVLRGADWHWLSPINQGQRSNRPVENAFAFLVQKAVRQIRQAHL